MSATSRMLRHEVVPLSDSELQSMRRWTDAALNFWQHQPEPPPEIVRLRERFLAVVAATAVESAQSATVSELPAERMPSSPSAEATVPVKPASRKHPLCVVKIAITMAAVLLSVIALLCSDPATQNAVSLPLAIGNIGVALSLPNWRRRCKRRCWVKVAVILAVVWSCVALAHLDYPMSGNCNAVLCAASALLSLIPATPFLANRGR